MTKRSVGSWETAETYVSVYPTDDGEGACDVEVQIGQVPDTSLWLIRTTDDAGGDDEADETVYRSEDEARAAAADLAERLDEADGETAEDYMARQLRETAEAGRDDAGEWCVWWGTALDDSGPRERYTTERAARAAATLANDALHRTHRGHLLCGFEVRRLVDGEWICRDES